MRRQGLSHGRRWYFIRCVNPQRYSLQLSHHSKRENCFEWVIIDEKAGVESWQKMVFHQMRKSCESFQRGYSLLQLSHHSKRQNGFEWVIIYERASSTWLITKTGTSSDASILWVIQKRLQPPPTESSE